MFSVQLSPGLRFKIGTDTYTILKHLENRKIQVEHHGYQIPIIFTKDELIGFLCKGELQFEVKGKNITPSAKGEISTSYFINDIESADYKEEALFRFYVIKPLLKGYGRTRADIIARVEEINELKNNPILSADKLGTSFYTKVSVATLYRWISDYENSQGDIRALVPSYQKSGGRGKTRIHPKAVEFVHNSIKETYLNQQRVTIEETFFDLIARITDYNEFSNEKIDIPSYDKDCCY